MLDAPLPEHDEGARTAVAARAADVLRPTGALARLDEVAVWLAGWQRTTTPHVERPACLVFVADHGVAANHVSAYPATVTSDMLRALQGGMATACVFAQLAGASLQVVDVGVGQPTHDLSERAAMDRDRFERSWRSGRAAVAALDADLLLLGEMGIGNTTAAAAVAAGLFGDPVEQWVGRGTGIDDEGLVRKRSAVERACRRAVELPPLEVLRQLGGCELVAMAGATYEARLRSLPVLLDGYVVAAAVAPLELERAGVLDHCVAAHTSAEPGHRRLLERLGKRPLLDLDLRLGEGTGALLAVPLVRMAAAGVVGVATFGEWAMRSP